uniref:putative pectinesterase/pectinesterase inhibitor 26 n=1 Tax=Erigeron canadensis TaxID=72917 RepID=UPI001CB8F0AE|nr:putative pectinesterase/pectinesterase inhibitor 26 [Erigeron canadensis]
MDEESTNFVAKPYRNLDSPSSSDDDLPTVPPPKRRRTVAIIVILTLFAVIIGTILSSTVINRPDPEKQSVKASTSIKAVCAVTKHPDLCYTDISSVDPNNYIDPEMIFKLTLQLTLNSLKNISSLPKILVSKTTDLATGSAVRDCVGLFEDAVSQLVKCVEVMRVEPRAERERGERVVLLDEGKVKDMMTWISGAMTDQETCVDGLEEMGSIHVEEVKMKIGKSSEMLSDCLAILNNMDNILGEFGLSLH